MGVAEEGWKQALKDQLAVTRLIGGSVCHRFNNLLAVADMCAMLGMDLQPGEPDEIECVRDALGRMYASSSEVRDLVALYARFVHGEAVQALPDGGTDLGHAFDVASRLLAHRLLRNTVSVEKRFDAGAACTTSMAPEPSTMLCCIVLGAVATSACCARGVLTAETPADDEGGAWAELRLRLRGERIGGLAAPVSDPCSIGLAEVVRTGTKEVLALGGAAALARSHGASLTCTCDERELRIVLRFPRRV